MRDTAGHRLLLSETNAGNITAVCSCAWIGSVHVPPAIPEGRKGVWIRDQYSAERAATKEWERHTRASGAVTGGR